MARIVVNGSKMQIATGYQTAFTITETSNANPAVATLSASHGVVVGDYVEITSHDWPSLIGRVFRVSAVSVNDVTLEGLNTSDTAKFPAAGGAGGGREVSGWSDVAQINELTVAGGEQQFAEGQYLDSALQFRYPTVKSAVTVTVNVDDDQSLGFWTHVKASESALSNRAFRLIDNASIPRIVATGIWMRSAAPAVSVNGVFKRQVSISVTSDVTEYAT